MTLLKPTIFLEQLVVQSSGRIVYDQVFHEGINVIYGENASGKSSIVDFIFFVLGGDEPRWKEAMLRCDAVMAGIRVNDEPITVKRDVSETRNQPMSIFWGPIHDAVKSAVTGWEVYPYRRSQERDSFSQVLFKAMEMPEVPAYEGSNITMHQVLRLVYQDQMSSPEEIFRHDEFDPELTRQTVAELLCGAFDPQLYVDQLRLRDVEKEFDQAQTELRSLFSALGVMGDDFSLAAVELELMETLEEQKLLFEEIEQLAIDADKAEEETDQTDLVKIRKQIIKLGKKLVETERHIESLDFQIADAQHFIETLQKNLDALMQSELTLSELGAIEFAYCPACFAPINELDDDDACSLCKAIIDESDARPHQLRMRRELEMQLHESREIQTEREKALSEARVNLSTISVSRQQLMQEYSSKRIPPTSKLQSVLRERYERAGWLERQVEILSDRIGLAHKVNELSQRKAMLNAERSQLSDQINAAQASQQKQRSKAYTLLSETVREMLNADLEREDNFISAKHVDFDFGKERITVDGHSRFAASSTVYLKNSFAFSFLLASLRDGNFRFPRLLILDSIEDKGMEEDRIHHFQNLMFIRSSESDVTHQVIFTAQTLSHELKKDDLIVGQRYTHDNKTLDFNV